MKLYFRDNFFSSGITEILNDQEEKVGHLDLKSAFSTSIDVYSEQAGHLYSGKIPFFSGKWNITGTDGEQVGILRIRFSFSTKKFTYETSGRGSYEINSPAFSKDYEIRDEAGVLVAHFTRVSGWFASGAFLLDNRSDYLDAYELVAIIMGMYVLQKSQAAGAGGAT